MIWETVDTQALRAWFAHCGIDVPDRPAFTRWCARYGLHPAGAERRGRSTVAVWRMSEVGAMVDRLTCTPARLDGPQEIGVQVINADGPMPASVRMAL